MNRGVIIRKYNEREKWSSVVRGSLLYWRSRPQTAYKASILQNRGIRKPIICKFKKVILPIRICSALSHEWNHFLSMNQAMGSKNIKQKIIFSMGNRISTEILNFYKVWRHDLELHQKVFVAAVVIAMVSRRQGYHINKLLLLYCAWRDVEIFKREFNTNLETQVLLLVYPRIWILVK